MRSTARPAWCSSAPTTVRPSTRASCARWRDAGVCAVRSSFTGAARPELWYPQFAVMAMSSDSEGMPLAVLEARAHGVPCVGPDVGGMREAIAEGGLVVAPGDAEALAEGILAVLGDSARADRLAEAAFAASSRWTAADTAAAYADLYARLGLS